MGIMFKNYVLIALRNIRRHQGYSFINIAGLALGMACCVLILAWVVDEVGTDRFHAKTGSIHIVRTTQHYGSRTVTGTGSVPALGPALKAEYPEVRNAARIQNGQAEHLLEHGDGAFREPVQMADAAIFEIFSFPLVKGSVKDVFAGPGVMVLSESAARRMFGGEDPLGRTVVLDKTYDFKVAAVMRDMPRNSTIRFDVWVPFELALRLYNRPNYLSTWTNLAFQTYVETTPGTDIAAFNAKIFDRIRRSHPKTILEPSLYPFRDVYLKLRGRMENVRIFSAIALLILAVACVNFMNLATARAARRAREVGLRKVVGAGRGQVMRQFFGESLVFTFVSLVLAFFVIATALPAFSRLTGKTMAFADFLRPSVLAGIGLVAFVTGTLAGAYPAVFLSSFRPGTVLKDAPGSGARGGPFRKALVVFQFALSGALIVGTVVIFGQVRYMKTKSLGFDRDHLAYIRLEGALLNDIESAKQELLRVPGVRSATAAVHSPLGIYNNGEGWDWEGRDPNVNPLVTYWGVDADFLETFGMRLVRGETFKPGGTAMAPDVVVNENFARLIGAPDVLNMRLSQGAWNLRIAGVVEDFHFTPVTQEIGPILIYSDPTYRAIQAYRYLFLRLGPGDLPATLASVERAVRERNPGYPFEVRFLDEDYDRLYRSVEREMAIVRAFTLLAIFISSLGLFGLAAYTAEQRRKEIGVRKVLGAGVPSIVSLLAGEYARWVLVANLVSVPVSYILMKSWLRDFPYRIPLGWGIFAGAVAATLVIAQLTVIGQAVRAARANPADVLRNE
jgi:ABC-type antimicrobial peptide transport system permease subunit